MIANEKFIINIEGKNFVTYEGLLDLAHQKKLRSIDVEILQTPTEKNNMTAICKAIVETENEKFSDIGDANPQSVNSNIIPHLIRIASTRAKARALRDLTNIGITSIEELALDNELEDTIQKPPPTKRQLDTIKKLSQQLNVDIPYKNLTRKTAGTLISKLLQQKNKKQ